MTKAMSIRKIDERTRTLGDMMWLLTERHRARQPNTPSNWSSCYSRRDRPGWFP